MRIETERLVTVKNFGAALGVSRQRAYKLIEDGRIDTILIDGVKFVDKNKYKHLLDRCQ